MTIILCAFASMAFAQSSRQTTMLAATAAGTMKAHDTTVNTDTTYLWDGRNDHNQWAQTSFTFKNLELSGTTTNTMIVQGSNDATTILTGTWVTLKNSTVQTTGLTDTATTKNVTTYFNIPDCQYKYLRIRNITGGTQTSTMSGTSYLASPYIKIL